MIFAPCSASVRDQEADFIRVGRPFPIPTHGSVARITVSFHLMNRIKHYVRDSGFDIIHYHEPLMPVLPVTALRFSKTCNVGTFHAFARSNLGYYYGKPLLKRYVRRLHARIAVSNPAREFVEHYFPGQYRIVPNGIDVERFRQATPLPEFRDGMINILFVGRLEYRKGLGYLLRAYEQLKPLYPNLRLIIAGDGPLRRWYGNFLARKQLPDIVMAGYVASDQLPRYYASCDIFCSPATGDESFGIVLLEAMAAGRPIVATNIDGFRGVVTHGREALLVDRKSKRQLAYALETLINGPQIRHDLARAGQQTVQQYDWEHVVDQVQDVYQQARSQFRPMPKARLEPSLSSG
jgi:phosphatidylinositol alpha-mannosyltransferase